MDDSASEQKPKLEDYYQPSDEMKTYAMTTMGENRSVRLQIADFKGFVSFVMVFMKNMD
jgi:hypothetical protein